MRALVTGASGFAGGHLISHLLACGDQVTGTHLGHEQPDLECELVELDIADRDAFESVVKDLKPDVVYHLAAMAFVPDAEKNFDRVLSINVGGVYNLLNALRSAALQARVVFISSSEVYGKITPDQLPISEKSRIQPANNYSLTKAMAELVLKRFEGYQGISPVIMRAFNHIGPGQRNDFVVSSFAYQLAQIAKGRAEPVLRVGNLDAKRDFTDVRDIVRGYRLAAQQGSGTYNLCSANPIEIHTILNQLLEISKLNVTIERDPERMRPSEVPEMFGTFDHARTVLGWQPEIPLRRSLEDTYNFWLKHD